MEQAKHVYPELSLSDPTSGRYRPVFSGIGGLSELILTRLGHWVLHSFKPINGDKLFGEYQALTPRRARDWLLLSRHELPESLSSVHESTTAATSTALSAENKKEIAHAI
jgi:hypothetical protein